MGRTRPSGGPSAGKQRTQAIFRVAGSKVARAKHKAKAVTTNLKKINKPNQTKTERSDLNFKAVQESLEKRKKGGQQKKKTQPQKSSKASTSTAPPPDMNAAADAFAKL